MNHKRCRPKSRRAGCLLCKPYKHERNKKFVHVVGLKGHVNLKDLSQE